MRVMPFDGDLVPSIRTPDTHENVILRREEEGDVALAFASVLPPNQDIDQPVASGSNDAQRRDRAGFDIYNRATRSVDRYVGVLTKLQSVLFCRVLSDLVIVLQLLKVADISTLLISLAEFVRRRVEMNVRNPIQERISELVNLGKDTGRVDDNQRVRQLIVGDHPSDSVCNPLAISFPIKPVAIVLQSPPIF